MKLKKNWPKVSIITPTLNSERTINEYFESISAQKYSGDLEVIIVDGGSTDSTLTISRKNRAKIFENKLKTAESGKALGVKKANGDLFLFIDSDNLILDREWIQMMVEPLRLDNNIVASEPISFTYRRSDFWMTRYFALIGMGDPINLFIGNYDRYSYVTNRWTDLKVESENKKGYLKIKLENKFPTIGANGFLIREKVLENYDIGDYLFDIDVLKSIAKNDSLYVAKVKIGVVHLFSGDINTFIRKQRRRIRDYLYYLSLGKRSNLDNRTVIYWGVIKFIISCIVMFPLLIQSVAGYRRKKDIVWIFHPIACYITLFCYVLETIRSFFIQEEYSREMWKQ